MLDKNTFDVLKFYKKDVGSTQRTIASELGLSLGTVNKIVQMCRENQWVDENGITAMGMEKLAPYKVIL